MHGERKTGSERLDLSDVQIAYGTVYPKQEMLFRLEALLGLGGKGLGWVYLEVVEAIGAVENLPEGTLISFIEGEDGVSYPLVIYNLDNPGENEWQA